MARYELSDLWLVQDYVEIIQSFILILILATMTYFTLRDLAEIRGVRQVRDNGDNAAQVHEVELNELMPNELQPQPPGQHSRPSSPVPNESDQNVRLDNQDVSHNASSIGAFSNVNVATLQTDWKLTRTASSAHSGGQGRNRYHNDSIRYRGVKQKQLRNIKQLLEADEESKALLKSILSQLTMPPHPDRHSNKRITAMPSHADGNSDEIAMLVEQSDSDRNVDERIMLFGQRSPSRNDRECSAGQWLDTSRDNSSNERLILVDSGQTLHHDHCLFLDRYRTFQSTPEASDINLNAWLKSNLSAETYRNLEELTSVSASDDNDEQNADKQQNSKRKIKQRLRTSNLEYHESSAVTQDKCSVAAGGTKPLQMANKSKRLYDATGGTTMIKTRDRQTDTKDLEAAFLRLMLIKELKNKLRQLGKFNDSSCDDDTNTSTDNPSRSNDLHSYENTGPVISSMETKKEAQFLSTDNDEVPIAVQVQRLQEKLEAEFRSRLQMQKRHADLLDNVKRFQKNYLTAIDKYRRLHQIVLDFSGQEERKRETSPNGEDDVETEEKQRSANDEIVERSEDLRSTADETTKDQRSTANETDETNKDQQSANKEIDETTKDQQSSNDETDETTKDQQSANKEIDETTKDQQSANKEIDDTTKDQQSANDETDETIKDQRSTSGRNIRESLVVDI